MAKISIGELYDVERRRTSGARYLYYKINGHFDQLICLLEEKKREQKKVAIIKCVSA